MDYDITIIGAGPAGATLARLLDSKYKILIVDKRNLDESEDFIYNKCCGGLLAPDAQHALAHLGLGLPKEIIVGPQMFSVKTEDYDNSLLKYYQRHYINLDREKFDRWQVSMIPTSVDKKFSTRCKSYMTKDGVTEIVLESGNQMTKVKTKILVGADGASSKIRRSTFAVNQQPEVYVAIQKSFEISEKLPYYISVFDRQVTDFYSWIIQKDHVALVGAAMKADKNANEKYDLLIKKLKEKGYSLGEVLETEGTWIMRPRSLKQINLNKGNIVLTGEAAGFISPSSAEGISYALRSGSYLADSLNKSLEGFASIYHRKTRKLRYNILLKHFKSIIMYNRITRKVVMLTGLLSMKTRG